MFEDQNQQKTNNVEDMFAGAEGAAAPRNPVAGPPSALAQGKLQPAQGVPAPAAVPASQLSGSGLPVKKFLALFVLVLVVAGAAGAAWWYTQGSGTKKSTQAPPQTPVVAPDTEEESEAAAGSADQLNGTAALVNETGTASSATSSQGGIGNVLENIQESSQQRVLDPLGTKTSDTDEDGLKDDDEYARGTNPRLVDSDLDGLSDWEEVAIFGSDPLNPDTDGDSYTDGEEVQNGYNPNGSGKLLNFEKARAEGAAAGE